MSNLNNEQLAAVNANLGHNLIIASAGTGKTSTIVARIEKLLNDGAKASEIMLLTFTNKAATEMIERLSKKLGSSAIKGIKSGTFHSISLDYLKKHKKVVLKRSKELRWLLKSIYDKYPKRDDLYDYSYLADIYSMYNNTCLDMNFYDWFKQNYEAHSHNAKFYTNILSEFEEQKNTHNFYDFDDLLLKAKDFFKNEFKDEFVEVLVDEYQDTNNLQSSILDCIKKKSLFCVGDYDQSIYAFNGANIEIIASFKRRYENAKIYSLNKNYRSTQRILDFANRVICNNERLYPKQLVVTRTQESKAILLNQFEFSKEQYSFVAEQISNTLLENPKEQIAVIYRNNSSGDEIERVLKQKLIKCIRKGGNSFYDLKEIASLINLAALCANKSDILSFIDILQQSKGVGAVRVNIIYQAFLELGNGSLLKGILNPIKKSEYNFLKKKDFKLGLFAKTLKEDEQKSYEDLVKSDFKHNPVLLLDELNDENILFLEQLYLFLKDNQNINSPYLLLKNTFFSKIFTMIIDNIAVKRAYIGTKFSPSLKEEKINSIKKNCSYILEDAKNYDNNADFFEKTLLNTEFKNQKGVQLLTVHASKGLEFNVVYLIDLAQGKFPNIKLSKNAGGIEEERRLFYVALTRAKNELILTWAKKDNENDKELIRSIFIDEGMKI